MHAAGLSRVRALVAMMVGVGASVAVYAQAPSTPNPALFGAWTINRDLSDAARPMGGPGQQGGDNPRGGGRGGFGGPGGGGPGGGGGRGGFGGGMGGGARGGGPGGERGGPGGASPEDRERLRDAMRELMASPARITIAQGSNMVLVTSDDGHVVRLSPDGKKVKDESTKIERKTIWAGGKLVSEITGLGNAKITETYAIEPQHHLLLVTVTADGPMGLSFKRVYDTLDR